MDWGKPLRKQSEQKIEKKNQKFKLPHVNKKPQPRKQLLVQTLFSHSFLKLDLAF